MSQHPASGPRGRRRTRALSSGTTAVTIAMVALSVLMYGFSLLAAHRLTPADFGSVSALLGVVLIVNVGALALQTTAARRIAVAAPTERDGVARDVAVSSWQLTAALTALAVLASPLLAHTLNSDLLAVLATAMAVAPLTMVGGYLGILQGGGRWWPLAGALTASGVGRLAFGAAGIAISPTPVGAMTGVALGACLPVLVAWWHCRDIAHAPRGTHRPVLAEVWRNGHTLLAYFVLTNVDLLVARNQFDDHTSGLYAAGSLITKACFLIPQIVLVVLFPAMARDQSDDRRWLGPVAAVTGIGLVGVAVTAGFQGLALTFVGGDAYAEMADYAWLFALAGTIFAALQVIVYRQIARQARVATWMWVGSAAIVGLGVLVADHNQSLVTAVIIVAAALALPVAMMRPRGTATGPALAEAGTDAGAELGSDLRRREV